MPAAGLIMASALMPVVGMVASLGLIPVSARKAFWSALMVDSTLIVAFRGELSETYDRVAAMRDERRRGR
jgi:hypothetical protein